MKYCTDGSSTEGISDLSHSQRSWNAMGDDCEMVDNVLIAWLVLGVEMVDFI